MAATGKASEWSRGTTKSDAGGPRPSRQTLESFLHKTWRYRQSRAEEPRVGMPGALEATHTPRNDRFMSHDLARVEPQDLQAVERSRPGQGNVRLTWWELGAGSERALCCEERSIRCGMDRGNRPFSKTLPRSTLTQGIVCPWDLWMLQGIAAGQLRHKVQANGYTRSHLMAHALRRARRDSRQSRDSA